MGLDGQLPTFQVDLLFIVSPFALLLLLLWLGEVLKRIFIFLIWLRNVWDLPSTASIAEFSVVWVRKDSNAPRKVAMILLSNILVKYWKWNVEKLKKKKFYDL